MKNNINNCKNVSSGINSTANYKKITGNLSQGKLGDQIFKLLLFISGIFVIVLIIGFLITLFISALPAVKKFGFGFFVRNIWDPMNDV